MTKWEEFRQFAISQMTGSSGRQRVPADSLAKFLAPAPESLSEQRAIAHILGSLDDKIELNRQMAQTLESIARAIFKSWFVDFDPVKAKMEGKQPEGMTEEIAALFPDRLVDSELGMIPEGWEVLKFPEEFDFTMGQSPPGSSYNEYFNGVPFYQGSADFGQWYPKIVDPIFEKIQSLEDNARTLCSLRDTLLPRLISGKIRLKQPEDAAA